MLKIIKAFAAIFSLATVAACGGGGGDEPTVNTAEGYWSGPSSSGYNVSLAVLENGETWGIYSLGSTIYGALNGTANGTGTAFTGSGKDYNFLAGTVTAGSFVGAVTQRTNISATSNTGGTVSLTYQSDYDRPASLANLAGTYSGSGRTGSNTFSVNIPISSQGTFSAVDGACTTTGALTPRSSGKNIFDFTANFIGTCILPGGTTVTGVAFLDTTVIPHRVLVLGLNGNKSDGMVIIGTKL